MPVWGAVVMAMADLLQGDLIQHMSHHAPLITIHKTHCQACPWEVVVVAVPAAVAVIATLLQCSNLLDLVLAWVAAAKASKSGIKWDAVLAQAS